MSYSTADMQAAPTKFLFVDSRVPDLEAIVKAAETDVRVVVLDAQQDGVRQIADALAGAHDVASIAVVSHGDEGLLLLGNGPLHEGNLQDHLADLKTIGSALAEQGDILLYGCDVGAGDAGAAFLAALAAATGADVAASTDATGGAGRGNWQLEISTGTVEGAPVLHAEDLANYSFSLHTASVGTVAALKTALATAASDGSDDTITLTGNLTFASASDAITINVTDGKTTTIVGGGFTLSGNNLARVLQINGGKVTLDNITISNGFVTGNGGNIGSGTTGGAGSDALGAGINNAGTLTITNSTITSNKAAGGGGAGSQVGGGGGAGGGGGGFGTTAGGTGGNNPPYTGGTGSAGTGGNGGGYGALGGRGGTTSGGAGGSLSGYSSGGSGGTANNGTISIGGGGGGAGYDGGGGAGGNAAGGIYNSGTLTITGSSVTNNIAAGGGGGGGATAGGSGGNGGNGGNGVGAIWNVGTLTLDTTTNSTLSTGNASGAGTGGAATKAGSSNGTGGTATSTVSTTGGGSTTVAPSAPTTPDMTSGTDTGTSNTDNITSNTAPTFTGTATAGATVTLYDTNGTTVLGTTTATGGNWSITSSTLSEGAHTLTAKATVSAVTSVASSGLSVTIDTTAPTATIATAAFSPDNGTSSSDFITNTAAQTISGTTSANMVANELVEVSIDNGSTWSTATTTVGSNTWSISKTLTASNTLKVRVSDAAGNTGTAFSQAYTLDTAAPTTTVSTASFSADTGTSASDFITKTAAQTISGTTSANLVSGEIVEVSIDNGSTWSTATTTVGANTWTINKTLTGSSTLKVRVSDTAGNSSTALSQAYVLDTAAPTTTIASKSFSADTGSSSSDFVTNTAAQTISGTTSANIAAGEFVEVSIDNGSTWSTATTTVGANTWSISKTLTGSDTLQVRVSDTAGNTGTASSQAYVLDTSAPTTSAATASFSADTGTSSTDFITKTTAQTISGTTSANLVSGEIVEVSIDNGSTWSTATTTVGANTWTLNKTLTGSSTLKVRVSDTAGNSSTALSQAYTLDTTAPTTTIATAAFSADTGTSSTDFITKTAAQNISGTTSVNLVAGEIVEVSLDNGSTWNTATTTVGANTWSYSGTLTASNTLKVRLSDTAGNSGTAYSQAYTLDTTAPSTPGTPALASASDSGSSNADRITNVTAATFTGTADAGSLVTLYDTDGTTSLGSATASGGGSWSITTSAMSEGAHTLTAKASDTAGNVSSASSSVSVTVDTTAPTTTIATAAFSADTGTSSTDFVTKTAAQTISGTTSANMVSGEIVEVSIDNGSTWSTATTTVGANTWSIAKTLTGSSTLKVRVSDTAGNSSTALSQAYTLDTTAPTATIATAGFSADTGSSASDFITNTAAQTIAGTLSANMVAGEFVEVSLDNGATWNTATTTVGANTWSYSGTLTASNTLKVRVSDTAGNSGTTYSQAYTLDTVAPTATIATAAFSADTGTSSTDFITKTAAQTISGTTSANMVSGEIVEVSIDNGSTWSTATTTVGANTWTINKTLTGSSTLKVRVSDTAGNSSTALSQAYTLDTTAPTATIATAGFSADTGSSASDFITNTAAQTISGTLSANMVAGAFVEVSLDNGATWNTATTTVGANTWSYAGTLAASNTLKVRVSDTAGNSGTTYSQAYTLDTVAPTTTVNVAGFSADTGTSSTDFITKTAAQTISGTTSANMVSGEIVEVSIDNGATWSTATTAVGSNVWSIAKTLTGSSTLKVRVSDTAGNSSTALSQAYTLDTTAPTATIASASFSADSGTSATDFITNTAAQTISGTLSANMVAGEIVEVSIDNGATWSTATTTVGANTWTIAKTLTASSTLQVRVSDTAGNSGTALSQAYTLDTTAPTTTIASKTFSADTGSSASDFITNTASQTISGTLSANMVAGEFVEVSLDNGATWNTATTTVGANTWSYAATLTGSGTLKVRVSDTAGNSAAAISQAYVLDTVAPTTTVATATFSADTGTSSSDFITKTAAQTIAGTLSANMVAGEIVEVSIDNGSTWSTATTTVGSNAWSIAKTLTGSSTLKVRVSDTAGNSSTALSQAYTLDTSAPAAPGTPVLATASDTGSSSSDGITSATTPTVTGTAEAGATVTLYDTDGTTVLGTATATGGAWSITSSALAQGAHTLTAKATDTAGNVGSASAGLSVTVDTAAPAAPGTPVLATASDSGSSNSDRITNVATPTITGTAEAGATVTLYDTDGTTVLGTATATGGAWSITSTTLAQGAHTLTAKATDTAGNVSTASSGLSVTIDASAPAAPGTPVLATASDTGSSSSDGITSATTPTITGTAEAGATVTLYDTDGTTVLGTATATGGAWSITSSALAQGAHTLTAKATDTAGNVSAASSGLSVTIDTSAPAAPGTPVLAAASDTGTSNADRITSATTPTITGTAEAGATVRLYDTDGTTVLGTATATGGAWSITTSALTQGAHTLTAKATDTAGNTGATSASLSVTVDTTAPTGTVATAAFSADTGSSATDFVTNTAAQTISGTLSANMVAGEFVEVSLDNGGTWASATTTVGANTWSYAGTLAGSNTLKVRLADTAGNTGTVYSQAYVLDTTAPATTAATATFSTDTGSSATDFITSTAAQTISGTTSANLAAGEIVEVSIDNGTTWSTATTTVGANTWSIAKTLTASSTLKVRVSDGAGNSSAALSQAYTLDTSAPAAPGTPVLAAASDTGSSSSDGITSATTPTVSGTAEAGSTVTLYDTDGTTVLGTATATAGNWSLTTSALGQGAHTLTAKATDAAGNVSAASTGLAITVDTTAPAISGVTSSSANGSYKIGDVIPVQLNFSEAVTVAGTPQLTLETGTVDRVVNYASGSGSTMLTFNYTVQAGDTTADLDYFSAGALALNGGSIRDAAGNDATLTLAAPGAAGSLGSAKNIVVDGVAPVFLSGSVTGNSVVLNYTEASTLDAVNKPAAGAFTVTAAGNVDAVTAVAVNAAARTVTLTLAGPVGAGQAVTVSYADPTAGDDANAIQDAAGNDAASLVSVAIANGTVPPGPPPNSVPSSGPIVVDPSPAEYGSLLTFDPLGIVDADGVMASTLTYQWLREGAAIAGATSASYRLGVEDVGAHVSLSVRYVDGRATQESLLLRIEDLIGDHDGVPTSTEMAVSGLRPNGQQGDGNGDGTLDAYQLNVTSTQLAGSGAPDARFVTLVADSARGVTDTGDGNRAIITAFSTAAVPGSAPADVRLANTVKFTVDVGTAGAVETFSMLFDASVAARGYWLQDRSGAWTNVTSALETSGGKTRIDFVVADGGPLDLDGAVNGSISTAGVLAGPPASIVGSVPGLGILPGIGTGFWF